ncbi:hypothetical protein, partial [Burkholderia latens]|uniref:hypothetical protein n=1 Tax=Burkholderia latens TaxID=488446 RepID=UPI001BA5B163
MRPALTHDGLVEAALRRAIRRSHGRRRRRAIRDRERRRAEPLRARAEARRRAPAGPALSVLHRRRRARQR